jgi:hypothetical protein
MEEAESSFATANNIGWCQRLFGSRRGFFSLSAAMCVYRSMATTSEAEQNTKEPSLAPRKRGALLRKTMSCGALENVS